MEVHTLFPQFYDPEMLVAAASCQEGRGWVCDRCNAADNTLLLNQLLICPCELAAQITVMQLGAMHSTRGQASEVAFG